MKLPKRVANIVILATILVSAACSNSEQMRIMSYNVHHCRGIDNNIDYKRIAEIINRTNPDVVALQELDSATERNNGKVCINELANATKMHASYTSTIEFGGGSYGIGLLSQQKPLSTKTIALESRGEARRLLIAEFEKYIVCCTHFPLNADDRKASAEIICNSLKGHKKPLLLAGDMNCHTTAPEQSELLQMFSPLNDPLCGTYPSTTPHECIDFIYALKNGNTFKILGSEVLYNDSIASDHLPLYVDVEF